MPIDILQLRTHFKAIRVTLLTLAIVAFVMSISLRVFLIQDGNGGTIFWKEDEADLFVSASHKGYSFTYLTYPIFLLSEFLDMTATPTDQTTATLVIRVTPFGVERHTLHYTNRALDRPLFVTPFDDGFYGMCQGGILCKLNGSAFIPATGEEQLRHDGVNRLVTRGTGFANGWRERDLVGTPGDHFQLKIGKDLEISALNHAKNDRMNSSISVKLSSDGRPTETIYDVDGNIRKVKKSEYEATFIQSRK